VEALLARNTAALGLVTVVTDKASEAGARNLGARGRRTGAVILAGRLAARLR